MASILDLVDRPHRGLHKQRARLTPKQRIERNITVDPDTRCWVWVGALMNAGYGQFTYGQTGYKTETLLAHRVSYEVHVGRIPQGKQLDHLCRNRACVNPNHLEPVTPRENILRSPIAPGALNARKTHCPQGHPYDEANTYRQTGGGRQCRACVAARNATVKAVSA